MAPDSPSDGYKAQSVPYRTRDTFPADGGGREPSYPAPHEGYGLPPQGEVFDWRHYLHVLWRKKFWILLVTLLGVGAGFLLARTVDPIYETRSTIWVETGDDNRGPIEAQEVFEGRGWSDLFTSYAVLRPVARRAGLYLDRESRGTALAAGLDVDDDVRAGEYRLSRDSTGREFILSTVAGTEVDRAPPGDSIGRDIGLRWAPDESLLAPGEAVTFSLVTPTKAATELRQNLTVAFNPRSGNLITTRLSWTDREEVTRLHNQLVQTFLEVAADLKSKKLREVVQILERQTEYAQERLSSAELALEEARVQNITLPTEPQASPIPGAQSTRGPVFEAYFERRLEANQLEADLEELNAVLEKHRTGGELDVLRLQSISALSRSQELRASLEELADKRAERRSLLYTYTEQHPDIQELDEEIRALRDQTIPSQIRQLTAELQSEIESLEGGTQAQERELREIPPRLIEEERLRREMQQAEDLHANLLSRLKNAELAASTSSPNLQVVDQAQPPTSPTSNEGPRLFFLASMAGLGLGIAGALLHDRMDSSVRKPEDIEDQLGLPVLGLVPRLPAKPGNMADTRAVLESFRAIRAQLGKGVQNGRSLIMVTSPEPRDGKSLVSANLAISFASSRKRTLLIDGDTRRGNAERLFGLDAKPGLTDCLTNGVPLAQVLKATEIPGLVLLPHGKLRGFDPDLLDGTDMDRLLEELRDRFDVIVVDAAPLAAGPDALLLGERCDQVLVVLRTGTTDREVARTRLESMAGFDIPLVGAVLNDVPDSAPYYRYYAPYRYYLEEGEVVS